MPQDVDVAVVRADLEKYVFRSVPLVQHFLDHVLVAVQSETNRPLIGLLPGVALHLHSHPFILAQDAKSGPMDQVGLGSLRDLTPNQARRITATRREFVRFLVVGALTVSGGAEDIPAAAEAIGSLFLSS